MFIIQMFEIHGILILIIIFGGKKNQFLSKTSKMLYCLWMLMHLCICGCFICPLMFHQAVDGLNSQLNLMRSQSDSVHTEASDLVFQQAGKADRVLFHTFLTLWKKKLSPLYFVLQTLNPQSLTIRNTSKRLMRWWIAPLKK